MDGCSYNIRQEGVEHHVVFPAKEKNARIVPWQAFSQSFSALGRGKTAADDHHVVLFCRHLLAYKCVSRWKHHL